ncbi:MarR family transcriptional regulator [Gorillibacterium sp. CAU 1737]|uniref:MarR family winged helix-turn-helix transcriptional regulator n=1 Tax=Gorillibacterium sp. CAU 1737 TaxID=3140362 RepID=UPI0032617383
MDSLEQQAYSFGTMLVLVNRLQVLGDKLDERVTLKQWLTIAVLLKSGASSLPLTELADRLGSSRQNVKKLVLLLEKQGFVALNRDDSDARILRVRLTEHCMEYFAARDGKEARFMDALFHDFDPALTEGLYRGLVKLAENIARMEDSASHEEKE